MNVNKRAVPEIEQPPVAAIFGEKPFYVFYNSETAPIKSRMRYDGIEWMPVVEHERDVNEIAEHFMKIKELETQLRDLYAERDALKRAQAEQDGPDYIAGFTIGDGL